MAYVETTRMPTIIGTAGAVGFWDREIKTARIAGDEGRACALETRLDELNARGGKLNRRPIVPEARCEG